MTPDAYLPSRIDNKFSSHGSPAGILVTVTVLVSLLLVREWYLLLSDHPSIYGLMRQLTDLTARIGSFIECQSVTVGHFIVVYAYEE
jgi:hypothetical protein